MLKKITAAHILVKNEFEIQDIQRKINEGIEFNKLANDFSICPSGKDGGNLGEFSKGMMVKAFEDVAFALNPNEISDSVKTQFGYHLIKRIK